MSVASGKEYKISELSTSQQPKIVDVFLFLQEVELLEIRLFELSDVVDYFVIVESNETLTGFAKNLSFLDNRRKLIQRFGGSMIRKLVYQQCFFPLNLKIDKVVLGESPQRNIHWQREYFMRNTCMKQGIEKIRPKLDNMSLIILGDVDEIPSLKAISGLKRCKLSMGLDVFGDENSTALVSFRQKRFHFNFHCASENMYDWIGSVVTSYKNALRMGFQELRSHRFKTLPIDSYRVDMEDGGWHFSNFDFQNGRQLWQKYRSFAETQTTGQISGDHRDYWARVMKNQGDHKSNTHCTERDLVNLPKLVTLHHTDYLGYLSPLQQARLKPGTTTSFRERGTEVMIEDSAKGVTRAIAVFVDNQKHFIMQARGLYASWNAVVFDRKPIDLLFFTAHKAELGSDLKCTAYTSHNDRSDCFIIPVNREEEMATAKELGTSDRDKYAFVKSIDFLLIPQAKFVLKYTHLMKTDLDTFITPAFARWIPSTFYVGKAAYAHMYVTQQRLHEWAEKFGFRHRGLHNLGATWYGAPDLVLEAARIAANVTMQMHERAFVDSVKDQGWPRWHKGVSSMYGQEIAINVVAPEAQPTPYIDHPSQESASINTVYHIHCWQGDAFFSKHAFEAGWYNKLNATFWNTADTRVWSLVMMQMASKKLPFNLRLSTYPEPVGSETPNFAELAKKPTEPPTPQPVTFPIFADGTTRPYSRRPQTTRSFLAPNVNVLIPTKDPTTLDRCLRSLILKADFKFGKVKFHFGINHSDKVTLDKVSSICKTFKINEHYCVIHEVYDRNGDVTSIVNFMFAAINEEEYFFRFNDDSEMKTEGWNRLAIEALRKTAPIDVGLAGIADTYNPRIQTHSFVSAVHKRIFSCYFPHHFKNLFEDDWISRIYSGYNLTRTTGIVVIHHFSGIRYQAHHGASNILDRSVDSGVKKLAKYLAQIGYL